MPSSHLPFAIAMGICVLTNSVVGHAQATDPPATATGGDAAPATSAGRWAHVDPQTGKRIPGRPPGVAIPPHPAFSTSHQGLVEKPAPGGGMMLDLQGRFRSAATATVGADGAVHVECVPPGAAARTK